MNAMTDDDVASPALDESVDADLMAFAARRRQERVAREAEVEATMAAAPRRAAAGPADGELEFVEVVRTQDAASPSPVKLERVIVEEVDPSKPHRLGDPLPSSAGAEMPDVEDSYAIKRVESLRMYAAATPTLEPTGETLKMVEEARRVNIAALEDAKKAAQGSGPALARKPAAAKPAAAKPAAKKAA